MTQLFANNAYGVLNGTITAAATSVVLSSGNGARFPSPTGGDFFQMTLVGINASGQETSWEVVKVTARTADTLIVVRAQEGTTAQTWASGTRAELRLTKLGLDSKANASQVMTDVPIGAVFTDTVYTHPTGNGNSHIPAGGASGQILRWSALGTASWGADENTTYSVGDGGLTQFNFTLARRDKLDGISAGANNYSHPTGDGNSHVPAGGSSGQILRWSSAGVATWGADANTTYSVGDGGLTERNFTATLKSKLDGVEAGANNYALPFANNSVNWNTAVTWGNHALAGYVKPGVTSAFTASQRFNDNVAMHFGNDSDLQLVHNGSHGYVTNLTGDLSIRNLKNSSYVFLLANNSAGSTQYLLSGQGGGSVALYSNGTQRLTTSSTGISVTGEVVASGNVVAYSDERLKKDIEPIQNALAKVAQLGGYTFNRTDCELRQTGVIAQEVIAVLPEAVTGGPTEENPDGLYGVAYGNLAGLFIEAIKELTARIEVLEQK